jgi:uncharacterized protein
MLVGSVVMDFLILSRATADASASDDATLDERHWSYMDSYADRMTARGPTLGPDRETWTGSMHVVALAGPAEARQFVAEEPYHRAGLFGEHFIWRFTNLLGRTMWEFNGIPNASRYLVIAGNAEHPPAVSELQPDLREGLILYGELYDLDDRPAGVAVAVEASSGELLAALLDDLRTALAVHDLDVHDWEFGGRR